MAVKVHMSAGAHKIHEYKTATHVVAGEHNYIVLRKVSQKPDEQVAIFPVRTVDHIDILDE